MSSRPDCNICNEPITMGNCACGDPWFGETIMVEGKRTKDERKYKGIKENNGELNGPNS